MTNKNNETVSISFKVPKELYESYKELTHDINQNVKGSLLRFMNEAVKYKTADISELASKKYKDLQ